MVGGGERERERESSVFIIMEVVLFFARLKRLMLYQE